MISDDERREVAATMRAVSVRGVRDLTLGEVLNSILTGGKPRPTTDMEILARLADLIDRPTCKRLRNDQHRYWRCSNCGAFVRWDAVADSTGVRPASCCPNCKAEVVE